MTPTRPIDLSALADEERDELGRLDDLIRQIEEIRVEAQSRSKVVQRRIMAEPWPLFIRRMRLISAQAWGSKIEAYLRNVHGWVRVDPSLGRGDAREAVRDDADPADAKHLEIKTSIITATNTGVNFVQIRPHHDVQEYHLFVVLRNYSVVHYRLDKQQMNGELELLGSLAHGTIAGGGRSQDNAEYAIRFEWDETSDTCRRWSAYEVGKRQPGSVCCSQHAGQAKCA